MVQMQSSAFASTKTQAKRVYGFYDAVRFAFPQRNAVILIISLTIVASGTSAFEPLVLKVIFDSISGSPDYPALISALGILAGLALLRELANAAAKWLTWRTRMGLQYAMLEATVGKLFKMPLRLQRSEGVGAIMTRLDRGIQGLTQAVTLILFSVLPSVMFLLVATWIMLRLEWRLALLVMLFVPLPALIARLAAPEQTRRERTLLDRWVGIYSRFNEALSGIVTVRSFAMEDAERDRFLQNVATANRLVIRGVARDVRYSAVSNVLVAVARLAAIAGGAYLVLQGEITLGTIVAFLGYLAGLFGPVQGLSETYQGLRRASVSLDEIFSIINVEEQLGDWPDAVEAGAVKGDVKFENVSFQYEPGARLLINGISFEVKSGATIGIVGPSGAGKTTLMALLMRFYDPQGGKILLDGRDLRTMKQSSVRKNIGVVLQDPLLFNDTIRGNIAYGKPGATDPEIEAAAKAANAHDFICRLPDGYSTIVGERGGFLSVGERQRITIARALIKDPPLLILDEATSSLDAESEALVQAAIQKLIKGRTTFIIAHRLFTVMDADHIMVLKDGQIVEGGTHAALMARNGYYASLVNRQHRVVLNDLE